MTDLTPEQWRSAAKWIRCNVLHGTGLDHLDGYGPMDPVHVAEHVADLLDKAADEVEKGHSVRACDDDD